MAPEDMEKTAFVIDEGIFYYARMRFGLKNAQAEFQQMVNDIFGDQIGSHMEVYVDDIILKSKKVDILPQDMREAFNEIHTSWDEVKPKKIRIWGTSREMFGIHCF